MDPVFDTLKKAFPAEISGQVETVLRAMDLRAQQNPTGIFRVRVDTEILEIPRRIYFDEEILGSATMFIPQQKEILSCLYSRHHNGFVRSECLQNIILSPHDWVTPYVIQLLGEYVVEILFIIRQNLDQVNRETYSAFLRTNPVFYEKTKQRVASYWDCYYRQQFPEPEQYVGFEILRFLDGIS